MAERSRFWDNTSLGDATEAPYDAATEFSAVMANVAGTGAFVNGGGVFKNPSSTHLNLTGTVSPVSIGVGRALVQGTWYDSDSAVSVAVPTPGGATRRDRIVLRKSWASQTVRITRIGGVEGSGTAPPLVQLLGTTWDVPLYIISVTTGGTITVLTDERLLMGGAEGAFAAMGDMALGDLLYAVNATQLARRAVGAANAVLGVSAGVPAWTDSPSVAALTASGNLTGLRAVLSQPTGTSPLSVVSTTVNANLNADLLDGFHAGHSSGQVPISDSGVNVTLNADMVDGSHATSLLARANHTGTQAPATISPQGTGSGLDADLVDGVHAATLLARANHTGTQAPATISPQGTGSGLDADTVDGYQASELLNLGGEGAAGGNVSLTTAFQVVATATGLPGTGTVLIVGAFDFLTSSDTGDNGNYAIGALYNLSDVELNGLALFGLHNDGGSRLRNTVVQVWVTSGVGQTSFTLRARKDGGSGNSLCMAVNTKLAWLHFR